MSRIQCVEFDGIDHGDASDFCDAFITYAERDGEPLTEEDLEELNEDHDTVYQLLMDYIY